MGKLKNKGHSVDVILNKLFKRANFKTFEITSVII